MKRLTPPVLVAQHCGWIVDAPMGGQRLPRPDWALFASSIAADGEHEVPIGGALAFANSSQLLLRSPSVDSRSSRSMRILAESFFHST
jgi:hypothetical protein